jgi:cytoskeletal protein CcmA (bactofilin family)
MPSVSQNQTILGQSIVLHGEMSGKEDLLIEGQLEGTINLPEHSVTVGSHGEVKAEVHARQVVVLGALTGNITASEKVEIRKTGQVVGDLVAAAVAIEDGAYFKGSIDILREQSHGAPRSAAVSDPLKASV